MPEAKRIFNGVHGLSFSETPIHALNNADALVIVTEWKEFRSPDFSQLKQKLKEKIIFDGRNLFDPQALKNVGIVYHSIGRLAK